MADSPQELRDKRAKNVADEARGAWADESARLRNLYLYLLMNNDGVRIADCPRLIAVELKRLYPSDRGGSK